MLKKQFEKIFICDVKDLKNISKRFIRETFEDGSIFIKDDISLLSYIKSYMRFVKVEAKDSERRQRLGYSDKKFEYDKNIFRVIVEHIISNLIKIKRFNDKNVSLKWIEETKLKDKAKRALYKKESFDWSQNINLHKLRDRDNGSGITTTSEGVPLKNLDKLFKGLTVYGIKGDKRLKIFYECFRSPNNFNIVEIAPTKIKLVKNIKNFISIEKFMESSYPILRNIATVEYLNREIPFLKELGKIHNISLISERLAFIVKELDNFLSSHKLSYIGEENKEMIKEIYEVAEKNNFFNETIKGLYIANKKELLNLEILINFIKIPNRHLSMYSEIPSNRVNLIVDYALSRKLFRPSVKAVLKLKKETIFNLKTKEENENT